MSTVESLEPTGRPFDPLKSFCNPALFNTAITRSKSLVVAVGNPLVLLLSEATMDNLKWCWREFISRCLQNETFNKAPSEFKQVEAQFYGMLKCANPAGKSLLLLLLLLLLFLLLLLLLLLLFYYYLFYN